MLDDHEAQNELAAFFTFVTRRLPFETRRLPYNCYSACRRRGGVLNSPRFCFFFFLLFFFTFFLCQKLVQRRAALMGDTAGHKPREPI